MSDSMQAQLNLVPEKTRLEMLIRAGAQPHPPSAARGQLRFTTTSDAVRIPLGTEAATQPEEDEEPVVFSVVSQTTVQGNEFLLAAGRFRRTPADDVDVAGALLPFPDTCPPAPGGLTCRSGVVDPDPSGPGWQTWPLANGADSLLFVYDQLPSSGTLTLGFQVREGEHPRLRYTWECFGQTVDCGVRAWLPCQVLQDTTEGFTRSGTVTLRLPTARVSARVRVEVDTGANSIPTQRAALRLPASVGLLRSVPAGPFDQQAPAIEDVTTYQPVKAIHGQLVEPQEIGVSSGLPNQRFALAEHPLTADWPLTVEVVSDGTTETWDYRATLADSLPTDQHFTIDLTTNELVFGVLSRDPHGTRQFGAIPEKNAQLTLSRHLTGGGGALGNVARDSVTVLRTDLADVTAVTNPQAFQGGADGEDLVTAGERTPLGEALPPRAVTAADYARLAPALGAGIARATVIPNRDPGTGGEGSTSCEETSSDPGGAGGGPIEIWPAQGARPAIAARATAHITLQSGTGDGREADLPAGTILEVSPSADSTDLPPAFLACEQPAPGPLRLRTVHTVPLVRHLGLAVGSGTAPGPWQDPDAADVEIAPASARFTTAFPVGIPLADCALTLVLSAVDPADAEALRSARPSVVLTAYCTPRADTGEQPPRALRSVNSGPREGRAGPPPAGQGTPEAVAFTIALDDLPGWGEIIRQPLATRLADALGNATLLEDEGFPGTAAMWLDVRVNGLPFAVAVRGLHLQATSLDVAAEQTTAVEAGTPLGTSSGEPGQRIALPPPAAGQTVAAVLVSIDGTPQTWTAVPSFASSSADSRHVVIDPSGSVHFGPLIAHRDGAPRQYGAVPPAGAQVTVADTYCTTSGARGNTTAPSDVQVPGDRTGFPDITASLGSAEGGSDAAPPDADTGYPARYDPVELLVVPYVPDPAEYIDGEDLTPDEDTVEALTYALKAIAPSGVQLNIHEPGYVVVSFDAEIDLEHGADPQETVDAVRAALYRYFNPLTGGPDGTGWPFGRPVHKGDAYREIEAVHGVAGVRDLTMRDCTSRTCVEAPSDGVIDVNEFSLVMSAEHHVCASDKATTCTLGMPVPFRR
ncbi:baseplate J/gp47 family protein [Streptomyces goshikiensis]